MRGTPPPADSDSVEFCECGDKAGGSPPLPSAAAAAAVAAAIGVLPLVTRPRRSAALAEMRSESSAAALLAARRSCSSRASHTATPLSSLPLSANVAPAALPSQTTNVFTGPECAASSRSSCSPESASRMRTMPSEPPVHRHAPPSCSARQRPSCTEIQRGALRVATSRHASLPFSQPIHTLWRHGCSAHTRDSTSDVRSARRPCCSLITLSVLPCATHSSGSPESGLCSAVSSVTGAVRSGSCSCDCGLGCASAWYKVTRPCSPPHHTAVLDDSLAASRSHMQKTRSASRPTTLAFQSRISTDAVPAIHTCLPAASAGYCTASVAEGAVPDTEKELPSAGRAGSLQL